MRRRLIITCLLLFICVCAVAQPKYDVTHYGVEDGLPQKTVLDILQDKKGFMWFSTYDGICKFDGSTFYSFKPNKIPSPVSTANRFDRLFLDKHGYIWANSHDSYIYRFDPRSETFTDLRTLPPYRKGKFKVEDVFTMPSGKLWITGQGNTCICFKDTAFKPVPISFGKQNYVKTIFEDKQQNSWLLTNNGLYQLSANLQIRGSYFTNGTAFFSVAEFNNELWFGTDKGDIYIYNPQTGKLRPIATGTTLAITSMKKIDGGHLLISTDHNLFFIYDTHTQSLENYNISASLGANFDHIVSCYTDNRKNVWLQTNLTGVVKFNPATKQIRYYNIASENTGDNLFSAHFLIWEDVAHRLWIHSAGGGFVYYDSGTDSLIPIADLRPPNTNYFSSMLHAGFSDSQGNLWLSTRSQGIEKLIFTDPAFNYTVLDPKSNINVRSIFEDDKNRIWIGTKSGIITVYDAAFHSLGCLTEDGSIGNGKPLSGQAYSMMQDAESNIWIGTKGTGIYKLVPDASGKKYKVLHFVNSKTDPYSISENRVYRIFADSHNRIWIGTYGGGLNLADNRIEGRFYNYKNVFKNYPIKYAYHVRCIAEDRAGKLYAGTTQGLMVLPVDASVNNGFSFKYYRETLSDKFPAGIDVYDICTAKNGDVYLATSLGIDKVTAKDNNGYPSRFFNYSTTNGLVADQVTQIKEDIQQKLWIVSEFNLMRFDPRNNSFENYYDINRLMTGENFSEGGDISTSNGTMLLGTTGGFVSINVPKIKNDNIKPYLAITGFELANHVVSIGNSSPLAKHIDDLTELKLDHTQNSITLQFAGLDYKDTHQITYQYKLDGADNDWVNTKEQSAKYINLPPGDYVFHVRSTNSKGLWLNNEHQLAIRIVPAFWQTDWAKTLYFIAALAIIFFGIRSVIIYFRLRDRLALEKEQSEMKSTFFTDVSHEIRTPLTMIISPVEHILDSEKTNDNVRQNLQLVLKNSKHMLRLVNQILDFRKIQHQTLSIRETRIGPFVKTIANDFIKTAEAEGIDFNITDQSKDEAVYIDRESLVKVVYNLLSNAFKHTQSGGTVSLSIFPQDDKMALQVTDNGSGMSAEIVQKLFKRYISYHPDKNKPNTGIGLSIVKEIIERHGATITVDSTEHVGSTFTILFLKGTEHFKTTENIIIDQAPDEPKAVETSRSELVSEPTATDNTLPSILLVEDDDDMRKYIARTLINSYRLFEAADGETAMAIATKELPDFIISDIMMPKLNGMELLKQLRQQQETSHIPLIFLTAKVDSDTETSAFDLGADAYITKPFSTKMLQHRVKTILEQRKKLYLQLNHQHVHPPPVPKFNDLNSAFIGAVKAEIEKNMSNAHFSVDNLISTMPMSRSVFVKKIKSLTGLSPIEYMRMIKFQYAARLIESGQYSIKEVSHLIGISDTKYFSHRFKEVIGVLPSDYKKRAVDV